jgi:hypothetical protein
VHINTTVSQFSAIYIIIVKALEIQTKKREIKAATEKIRLLTSKNSI